MDISAFAVGDHVVHENYGIGIFQGTKSIIIDEQEQIYLKIVFAESAILSVPPQQKNLVHRYIGSRANLKLSKISKGNKEWLATKKKVKKKVEDMTMYLVNLYRKKKTTKVLPTFFDKEAQQKLEEDFSHLLTKDQKKTISEIEQDLLGENLMDRIVCGDVGFGKTEVALHIILQLILSKNQVAFLVPTTLLSEQHYENFLLRLKKFKIRIAVLNRFKTTKETNLILEKVKNQEIDLLIGTHKILGKNISFKNLGLLVIDEEHKFGVKQKEIILNEYVKVHTLSLTATPIPRTMHMSLVAIKKISTIKTPPKNRKNIQTYVGEFDIEKICNAIKKEKQRAGQIFFIHNAIHNLDSVVEKITKQLPPEIITAKIHGQMHQEEIQDTIHLFINKEIDLIFSTTIVESGIDIPNVNTLIVNNAHFFGLSSLHQMRGRIGRSDREGYAYFFYPSTQKINDTAKDRLVSIETHNKVGDGFEIALRDMEIRGIGNVFGADQSGNIVEIGLELYSRLIKEAIEVKQL